jgi:hypothetical protein
MNRSALRSLVLLLTLAAPAVAQEYGISGEDVAGRARVHANGTVEVRFTTFSRKGAQERSFTARVVSRSSAGFTLRYTHEVEEQPGFVDVLLGNHKMRKEPTTATFTVMGGGLRGRLHGVAQTWIDQSPLAGVSILVVPGLSTNLWNQYSVPYLDENLAALRARGLRARRLAINTEESIAVNAARIAEEIRLEVGQGRRVVLLAHSKGGADTITCLADPRNASLLPSVVGLMAIQPVYGGSPIADLVGTHCLIQKSVDLFFERVLPAVNRVDDTGSGDAVQDLRSARRQALLRQHPYPVDRIPTVVVRSSFSGRPMFRPRHVLREPLWVFQKFLEKTRGIQSDGMVALEWQRVPGAAAEITLQDMDHFEPGFRGESPHSPCEVTNTIVDAMLGALSRGR